jgi:hypothetical protein
VVQAKADDDTSTTINRVSSKERKAIHADKRKEDKTEAQQRQITMHPCAKQKPSGTGTTKYGALHTREEISAREMVNGQRHCHNQCV